MRSKLIARNSLWIALDTGLSLVTGLVISVMVARFMGPQQMGYYTFINWVTNMVGTLATFGPASTARKFAAEYIGRGEIAVARKIVGSTFRWQLMNAVVAVSLGFALVLGRAQAEHRTFYLLAILSLFPGMLRGVFGNAIAAAQDYSANAWPSLLAEIVNLTGTCLTLMYGWGLIGLTSSMLAARSIDLPFRYYLYRNCFKKHTPSGSPLTAPGPLPPEIRERLFRFSWQTTILMILDTVVWDRSEIFFLKFFGDIRQVAFYSLTFGISQQILLLPQVFASASGANIMVEQGRDPRGLGRVVAEVLRYMALLAFPLTLGLAALSAPAIRFLYGEKFLPAIPVLLVAALFCVPRAFLGPAHQLLLATENQAFLVKWGIATAVLNLSLDLWWIPGGGAIGAAFANGLAQTIAVSGIWVFAFRRLRIPIPGLALQKILTSALLMAALSWVIGRSSPPFEGALFGVAAGVAAYALLLRWTRSLHSEDRERLIGVRTQVPGPFREAYVELVRIVIP